MRRFALRVLLPSAFLAAGGFGAFQMVQSAETAERQSEPAPPPLVETAEVSLNAHPSAVRATGVVEAARQVTISPEVTGKVVSVSDGLVIGGRVRKGQPLFRIDRRQYELALRQTRTQVEQAQLELKVELGRGQIAEREWELLSKSDPNMTKNDLALRKPYREAAEVAVESAQAAREQAQLDLSRTAVTAPFNAIVVEESLEPGQIVRPGTNVATLIGTDEFWVHVQVPVEDLALLKIPERDGEASVARVIQPLGNGPRVERTGRVVRLAGDVDRESRTATVLVAVEHPLDVKTGELPLLRGAFVTVEFDGREIEELTAVPRDALVDGNDVWRVTKDETLERRALDIVWEDAQKVYARAGVEPGDRVVTSDLATPLEGMHVRTRSETSVASTRDDSTPAQAKG